MTATEHVADYGTSPLKRSRATKAEMAERRRCLLEIVRDNKPCTVRNIYYRAVVAGLVPKNDAGYGQVQRTLVKMREAGEIPFRWITDNTRVMRKPATFGSMQDALLETARFYRRDLWAHAGHRVEVWCESDSIGGVIADVTEEWDVPLFATRGFSSVSFLASAADAANDDGRPFMVLYVGDHDPAGLEIEANVRRRLGERLTVAHDFKRVGVTWAQVDEHDLPGTRPKKPYGFPLAVEAKERQREAGTVHGRGIASDQGSEAMERRPRPSAGESAHKAEILDLIDEHALAPILAAEDSERELLLAIANREVLP